MSSWIDNVEIWGFGGKMGCGKNYLAEEVLMPILLDIGYKKEESEGETMVVAFADHLKIHCLATNPSLSYENVFGKKTSYSRQILQSTGTNMRHEYGADVFIRALENWIRTHASRGIRKFIITDIRRQNELDWVHRIGGKTIYIHAPNRNESQLMEEAGGNRDTMMILASHESERLIESMRRQFSTIVENDYGQENLVIDQIARFIFSSKLLPMPFLGDKTKLTLPKHIH